MFWKTNENKFNKQAKMQQTSRHGVAFSMFSLSTASLSSILQGKERTAVDEANKIGILTVRLSHCQIAATCVKNGTTYTDNSCVPNVT
jgi:hypothetical protein